MLKSFQIGDKIKWTDEPLMGTITSICGQKLEVLLNDGFSEWVHINKVVLDEKIEINLSQDEEKFKETKLISRDLKVEELDLHIENLFADWRSIPREQILERQLNYFKEEYREARKNCDKLIVIHGKGKGILKSNITAYLNQSGQSYKEMKHGKYKDAAIEIRFHKSI